MSKVKHLLNFSSQKGLFSFLNYALSIVLILSVFISCQKDDLNELKSAQNVISENNSQAKQDFFTIPKGLPSSLERVIQSIKKHDDSKNFVTSNWIKKNGVPLWNRTVHNLEKESTGSSLTGENENTFNLYFTPLQDQNNRQIKSYIVSYQRGEHIYYRFYGRDALEAFIPVKEQKTEILTLLTPFAFFEKAINNQPNIKVEGIYNQMLEVQDFKITNKLNSGSLGIRSMYCTQIYFYMPVLALTEYELRWKTICYDATGSGEPDFNNNLGNGGGGGGAGNWQGAPVAPNYSDQNKEVYRDQYTEANFTNEEFEALWMDKTVFSKADAFLNKNSFYPNAITIIKNSLVSSNVFAFNVDGKVDGIVSISTAMFNSNSNEAKLAREAVFDVQMYLHNMEAVHFPTVVGANSLTPQKFVDFAYTMKQIAGMKKLGDGLKSTFLSMKAVLKDNTGTVISSFDNTTSPPNMGENMGVGFGKIDQQLIYGNLSTRAIGAFGMELEDVDTHYKIEISLSIVQIQSN
jgi:hypothetical protein